jgi:hypothetical protein
MTHYGVVGRAWGAIDAIGRPMLAGLGPIFRHVLGIAVTSRDLSSSRVDRCMRPLEDCCVGLNALLGDLENVSTTVAAGT